MTRRDFVGSTDESRPGLIGLYSAFHNFGYLGLMIMSAMSAVDMIRASL